MIITKFDNHFKIIHNIPCGGTCILELDDLPLSAQYELSWLQEEWHRCATQLEGLKDRIFEMEFLLHPYNINELNHGDADELELVLSINRNKYRKMLKELNLCREKLITDLKRTQSIDVTPLFPHVNLIEISHSFPQDKHEDPADKVTITIVVRTFHHNEQAVLERAGAVWDKLYLRYIWLQREWTSLTQEGEIIAGMEEGFQKRIEQTSLSARMQMFEGKQKDYKYQLNSFALELMLSFQSKFSLSIDQLFLLM